ncbi:MAG: B12-binding domain-containing radical SAM protein [Planctomycetota bacterium]|jgi:radical SAM superfamily enzyme YgiQ (UPF0313 family)
MRILLVYPNKPGGEKEMPLGLGYLASFVLCKNDDIRIDVFDAGVANKREANSLLKGEYDIVGFTVTSQTYRYALELAKIFKEHNPDAIMVFGGPHVSIMMDQIMQEPLIDVAVYGEGELTFDELIKYLKENNNKLNAKDFERINGLIYRENGQAVVSPPRKLIEDLDALPFPAFHLFSLERYPGKYPMITCRGCPFACVFCASSKIWRRKWRARSPENIIAEVKYLIKNFGPRPIDFHDDSFNIDLKRANTICDLFLDNKIRIPWGVRGLRADIMTPNLASKMRKAGCSHVAIGIESANLEMLERMGKHESIAEIKRGIDILHSAGIDVTGQFMIGNPGETLETVMESIKFAEESDLLKAIFGSAVPFPGTGLWDYVQEHGQFLVEPDCTRFEEIEPRIIFETPEFSKEQRLEALRLSAEAGMRPPMKPKADFAHKIHLTISNVWFRFLHKYLPRSISYRTYFLLRRIRAVLQRRIYIYRRKKRRRQ